MRASLPSRGTLSQIGFCELLALLCRTQATGTLRLQDDSREKSIYLQEGRIVFASSKEPGDRLGELLLNRGVISPEQFEEASRLVAPGRRLGTILVELGYLPAKDLPRWVLEQVKEVIFSLFTWTKGSFHFEAGPLPSREVITLRLSTAEIFLAGVRRVTQWSILKRDPAEDGSVFRLVPEEMGILHRVKLSEREQELLDILKERPRHLSELVEESSFPPLAAYQFLFALRVLGVTAPTRRAEAEGKQASVESDRTGVDSPESAPAPPSLSDSLERPDAEAESGMTPGWSLPVLEAEVPLDASGPDQIDLEAIPLAPPGLEPVEAGGATAAEPVTAGDADAQTVMLRKPLEPAGTVKSPPSREGAVPISVEASSEPPILSAPVTPPPAPESFEDSPPAAERMTQLPESAPVVEARKKEYQVVHVPAQKLKPDQTREIEQLLVKWGQRGYHLAGVVPTQSSGLFGSAPSAFFIFARD